MLTLLTTLCLLSRTAAAVNPPRDVRFSSYNLRNVVEWSPGPEAPSSTLYIVEYAIYGDEEEGSPDQVVWRAKRKCARVAGTRCDLSNETRDLEEKYYARVRAEDRRELSEWVQTDRFDPRSDTTFGPPTLNVTVKDRNMMIAVQGPGRWKSENAKREQPMSKYYPQMRYNLSVYNSRTKQLLNFIFKNNSMELNLLDFDTRYCVSVSAFFLSGLYKTQGSQPQCVTTSKDPTEGQLVFLFLGGIIPVAIVLFLLFLTVFLMYHYIFSNRGKKPKNLSFAPCPLDSERKVFSEVPFAVNVININKTEIVYQLGCDSKAPCKPSAPSPLESEAEKVAVAQPKAYASQHAYRGQEVRVEALGPEPAAVEEKAAEEAPNHGSDYGFVTKAPPAEVGGAVEGGDTGPWPAEKQDAKGAPDTYKQQWQPIWPSFQEDPEEEESTIVNWDPETKQLQIPLLPGFEREPEPTEEEIFESSRARSFDILSKVYIRQSSEASSEPEDDLTKMEKSWALWVNMGK